MSLNPVKEYQRYKKTKAQKELIQTIHNELKPLRLEEQVLNKRRQDMEIQFSLLKNSNNIQAKIELGRQHQIWKDRTRINQTMIKKYTIMLDQIQRSKNIETDAKIMKQHAQFTQNLTNVIDLPSLTDALRIRTIYR